jgi:hypothetical protein
VTLVDGATQQFTAQALDQFSQPLAAQPSLTWSKVSGRGSVNKTGLYTAPSSGTGTAVVQAQAGGKAGQAIVTIVRRGGSALALSPGKKASAIRPPHKRRHA